MTNAQRPIILHAGEGDRRSFLGGGLHTWKLLSEDTGGAFFLFEDDLTEGKVTPLHQHPEADETVYVIEGEIITVADGEEHKLGPGSMSFIPRGTPHAFRVVSSTARLLTIQTPGVGQSFYRGASDAAVTDEADRVDIARLQQSAAENPHGIQLLGPPPFAHV
ncbi:MAG: cupin domain-containing protein [Acidimicrobiales bacterium]|nr:cupin domain-containing protein [Acidimicrobiales bacterium]